MLKGGGGCIPELVGAAGITGKTKPIYFACKPYLDILSFKLYMK